MTNGDPLAIGITQFPYNRATASTALIHDGSAFGTQNSALWVQRLGTPIGVAAVRGDNFSTGPSAGQTLSGVLGMVTARDNGVGVLGAAGAGPKLFFGETGVLGVTNSFGVVGRSSLGVIVEDGGTLIAGTGVVGESDGGVGVHGVSTGGWGVIGQSAGRAGVTGSSRDGVGVEGRSDEGLAGVHGSSSDRYGVYGESQNGVGVLGTSPTNAVQGVSTGTSGPAIGVTGYCRTGQGVLGGSETGIGIGGRSRSGWAGYFEGNVIVQGDFYVSGRKSAAVPHPDGSLRSLYCLESPESYFEDFGEAVLTGESVRVALDEDFAALVRRGRYQVFLTSYGPQALYVSRRDADGFEIARVPGDARRKLRAIRVGYRIVARRRDLRPARLPKVATPPEGGRLASVDLDAPKTGRKAAARSARQAAGQPLPQTPRTPQVDVPALTEEVEQDGEAGGGRRGGPRRPKS
jgi:hypothetical protein